MEQISRACLCLVSHSELLSHTQILFLCSAGFLWKIVCVQESGTSLSGRGYGSGFICIQRYEGLYLFRAVVLLSHVISYEEQLSFMHLQDFLRQNNTGKLLWQVFGVQAASLCVFGIVEHEEIMWNEFMHAGSCCFVI